jgi:hypothetical protein
LIVDLHNVVSDSKQQSILSWRRALELAQVSQPAKPNAAIITGNEIHWPA